jgi:16S rRNA (guanine527-N7)-methyltransferase
LIINNLHADVISDAQIHRGLASYGVLPDGELRDRIRDYISLLLLWNQKISLTTVTKPEEIIRFHFGESFFAVRRVPIENGRLADVGSGAGFPGIPIAMLCSNVRVTLIESNLKKTAFLSEAIRKLELSNARVVRARMEDFDEEIFDFVTARALGLYEEVARWSSRVLAASGRLILWVGEDDGAVIARSSGWGWQNPIRMPGSRRRVLLVGSRDEPTG